MDKIYSNLLINNIDLTNRLVMAPMASSNADIYGRITTDTLKYYDERTIGGRFGLVVVEHSYVDISGRAGKDQISVADDACIEGLSLLANKIHKNGSKAIVQINHSGIVANHGIEGFTSVAPSMIDVPLKGYPDKELTIEEINSIKDYFLEAGRRVIEAGFDGIEIHSAHGYLLNLFYSPLSNIRNDEYGSNLRNRVRLHTSIIKGLREKLGNKFLLALRLGAKDYLDGGSTVEDAIEAGKIFQDNGLDILDISGGLQGSLRTEKNKAPGYFSKESKAIKAELNIPVITTGGVKTKEFAEELLINGCSDLVGIGRAIYQNSKWGI